MKFKNCFLCPCLGFLISDTIFKAVAFIASISTVVNLVIYSGIYLLA